MFTKMNTDPENIFLWDALKEIMESEKEYEEYVTQNVCNDANDSITLTGVWRLHNQVYPYTKTNWMGVVSIIENLLTTITLFCGYEKYEASYMVTDPDSKAMHSFMLVSKAIKEPLRFDIMALNGSNNLGDFLPRDVIYVLKCGCHHMTFTMNSLTEFCERYLETFKKFVAGVMLWAWDVDMSHNERMKMVQTIKRMDLENFLFGKERMYGSKEYVDKLLQKPMTNPMPSPLYEQSTNKESYTEEWLSPYIKAYYMKGDHNAPVLIVTFRSDGKRLDIVAEGNKVLYATNVFSEKRHYKNIMIRDSHFTQEEYSQLLNGGPDLFLTEWKKLYDEYKSKLNK